jgi:murein DD-endopeptidase MepM/ murein hydrolase activator NlpD
MSTCFAWHAIVLHMTDPPRETTAKVRPSRDGAREAELRTRRGVNTGGRLDATTGRPSPSHPVPQQLPRLGFRARVRKLLNRYVPAREVLFLGPGPIMSRRFSPRRQIAIGLTGTLVAVWLLGASVDVVVRHYVADRMGRELARLRATTQADAAEFARLARVAGDLAKRHAQFRAAANDSVALGGDLARLAYLLEHANAPGGSDDLVTRVSNAVAALAQAHGRQASLSIELAVTQNEAPPPAAAPPADGQARPADGQSLLAVDRPAEASQAVAAAEPGWTPDWRADPAPGWAPDWAQELQQRLADQKTTIVREHAGQVSALADAAQAEAARQAADTARQAAETARATAVAARELEVTRFNAETEASRQVVADLTARTRESIQQVEAVITSTGLNLNHLAPVHLPDSHDDPARPRGGPFVPWTNPPPDHTSLQLGPGEGLPDIDRLQALTGLLQRMPLSIPVDRIVVSSPYGYRLDPFTGAPSMHEGIDLEGAAGTPILATAPGVVTFSGTRPAYGGLVEIKHGSGLMTRYSHLERELVQAGDHVALHQEIGLMGTTGRSTGVHLYYEVWVNGVTQNPANFMKGKSHVLEPK